jgi:hypothetical protein
MGADSQTYISNVDLWFHKALDWPHDHSSMSCVLRTWSAERQQVLTTTQLLSGEPV